MTQAEIKALIDEKITSNGAQEITGEVLNDVLQEIADACGYTFDIDVYPADAALEITFYNPGNPDGVAMKVNAEVSNLGNSKLEAISAWWAAQTERKLNKTAGYDIDLTNVSTSPSTLGVTKVIEAGQIIQSFTGASKLIFGATDATNVTVNSTDLPYTATKTLYNVKLESGTAANLKITVANGIVSVSQNTSTEHTEIHIGGNDYPVPSVDEVNGLKEKVNGSPSEVFDLSTLELNGGIIVSGGIYYNVNPYDVYHQYKLLPISDYKGRTVRVVAKVNYKANIAFLAGALVNGETAPFCNGTSLIEQSPNTSVDYIVPNDCVNMYVYYKDTRQDYNREPSITALASSSSFYTKEETDNKIEPVKVQSLRNSSKLGVRVIRTITEPIIRGRYYPVDSRLVQTPIVSEGRIRLIPIMVSNTAKYWYTGTVPNADGANGIVYMDNNGNIVGTELPSGSSPIPYTEQLLTIPENAVWICVNSSTENIALKVEDFEDKFVDSDKLYKALSVNKMLVPITLTQGYRVTKQGTIIESTSGYIATVAIDRANKYYLKTIIDNYGVGVGFYNNLTTQDDTTCVGILFTASQQENAEGYLPIPDDAVVMVLCTRSNEQSSLQLSRVKLSNYIKTVELYQGTENSGKVMMVGDDGNIYPEETPSPISIDKCVRIKDNNALYLGANILSGIVGSGTGWSENEGVYTHSTGNATPLTFAINTENGESYVAIFKTGIGNFAENAVNVSIGNGQLCDVYDGTTGPFIIGIVSDGGYLKITPASNYNSTVYDIELRKIVNEEDAVITLTPSSTRRNVESNTMVGNITSWWNVAIGDSGTLAKSQNSSRCIAIGHNALNALESGERNIGIGTFAMNALKYGVRNIAIGADCLWTAQQASDNIAIGKVSMGKTGSPIYNRNVAIGTETLEATGIIEENVAIGHDSMAQGGSNNIYKNVCIGFEAGYYSHNKNTYIGYRSGRFNLSDNNVFVGAETGLQGAVTNISNSVVVGYQAKVGIASNATFTNSIAIGYQATATKDNQCVIGNSSVSEFVLGGKKIVFNNDNSITWENV